MAFNDREWGLLPDLGTLKQWVDEGHFTLTLTPDDMLDLVAIKANQEKRKIGDHEKKYLREYLANCIPLLQRGPFPELEHHLRDAPFTIVTHEGRGETGNKPHLVDNVNILLDRIECGQTIMPNCDNPHENLQIEKDTLGLGGYSQSENTMGASNSYSEYSTLFDSLSMISGYTVDTSACGNDMNNIYSIQNQELSGDQTADLNFIREDLHMNDAENLLHLNESMELDPSPENFINESIDANGSNPSSEYFINESTDANGSNPSSEYLINGSTDANGSNPAGTKKLRPWGCGSCGALFSKKSELNRHWVQLKKGCPGSNNRDGRPRDGYECQDCGKLISEPSEHANAPTSTEFLPKEWRCERPLYDLGGAKREFPFFFRLVKRNNRWVDEHVKFVQNPKKQQLKATNLK